MKKVWRVCEDGEIRDTYKKLRVVFEMTEEKFFNHYSEVEIKEENTFYRECQNEISDVQNNIPEIPFSNAWIGFAIAQKFVESGCAVIIAGRNELKLQNCVKILGEKAKYITLDVSDINDIKRKIPAAMELFPRKIDILVNCAGVGVKHSFWDIDEKEYDDIMNTNTRGMFFVSQLVSKYMVDNHIHGHILNVSSSSGARPAWTPYEMSKWAVNGFTRGLH